MRITWISHTNITSSETFIADTLNIFYSFAKLQAISGHHSNGYYEIEGELELTGYNLDQEPLINKIIKKYFSLDIHYYREREKAL